MDPIRDIGRAKRVPTRGGIFAALGDDSVNYLTIGSTLPSQFEVVRQFGVESSNLRIVIGVGNCRPDVLPPRLNNVKP